MKISRVKRFFLLNNGRKPTQGYIASFNSEVILAYSLYLLFLVLMKETGAPDREAYPLIDLNKVQ